MSHKSYAHYSLLTVQGIAFLPPKRKHIILAEVSSAVNLVFTADLLLIIKFNLEQQTACCTTVDIAD